ncbi:hypothetical protein D9M68_969690 [compost metagenome]
MEGEEGRVQQAKELERDIGLAQRHLQRIAARVPWTQETRVAKRVAAVAHEAVPVAGRKAQLVFHAFAEHQPVLVVVAVGKGLVGRRHEARAAEGDGLAEREVRGWRRCWVLRH